MLIAVTGTPGTGKTTALAVLRSKGRTVVTLEDIARKCGAVFNGEDVEVDTEILSAGFRRDGLEKDGETVFVDGHLAHHIPADKCIVLRCDPSVLARRLAARKYPEDKVWQNLEAEAIDLILVEALEMNGEVHEVDTSNLSGDAVAAAIESIASGEAGARYKPGGVDWSGAVLSWY